MSKATGLSLTILAGVVAIAAPILLALQIANRQGKESEQSLALRYARDVLHRSDRTGEQLYAAIDRLNASGVKDQCAPQQIAMMREINLTVIDIQAIGYVSGNHLLCSSLGSGEQIDLGEPDVRTAQGSYVRANARLPFATDAKFTIIERNGYAVIINQNMPIDITAEDNDVSLALITPDNRQIRSLRGDIKVDWIDHLDGQRDATFVDGNSVVAVVRSARFATVAVAALPVEHLQARIKSAALVLVPTGLVAGAILAWAMLWVMRLQVAMPAVIKSALRRHEFSLVYLPIVDLRNRNLVGAEALIRWRRPSGEMVPPDIFIRVAEDSGLIQRITERVINLLARDAWDFFRRHPNLHLGINVSSIDLHSARTVSLLGGLARAIRARAGNLFIEVTERGLMNEEEARENLRAMRAAGIRVAIDDFGTGYSSLSYLESFELDYLKIDKSFVDKIGTEAATSQVITHIIHMAKDLQLQMIAEGVETEAQAQFLAEHGVQYAQGWLFGRPMEFSELESLLMAQELVAASEMLLEHRA